MPVLVNVHEARGVNEWKRGWRIVLGCALGSGTGVVLLFFTFSIFILPIIAEFGGTRGDLANVQALVVSGALGSPVIGWATDRFGFRRVFLSCMVSVILLELWTGLFAASIFGLAVAIFLISLIGVGSTALTVTRPVNAWFDANRGLALGFAAMGSAIATIIVPPLLEAIVADHGWRVGFLALAGLAACIGLPAVYWLVENEPPSGPDAAIAQKLPNNWAFLAEPQFWLMAVSLMAMGAAGAGFIGQMSPMIQQEGLSAVVAALALSAFAGGQVCGRLSGGWCLDRFNPRLIAVILNLLPAAGFIILWMVQGSTGLALLAAFLIGFQQGAELDIFAYFTARRFGIAQYGTVYGALLGLSWIGNAAGLIGVGRLHDLHGDYALAQLLGAASLGFGALLISAVRLPERGSAPA